MLRDPLTIPQPKIEEVPLTVPQPRIEEVPLTMPQHPTIVNPLNPDPIEQVPLTECPMDVNPFGLTNDEIDELLKGLEGIRNEILKGLEESCVSEDHSADAELNSVLDMCVEDYIV